MDKLDTKRGKKRAPKYRMTDVVAALDENFGIVLGAARRLGCSRQTIHNYAERYPEVKAAIQRGRGEMVDLAQLGLRKALIGGEAWAILFTLKTLGKNDGYTERQEISGVNGEPITFTFSEING